MKRTRVCDLLKVKYPILQGGMLWLADAELAAAVSNSGALGIISPLAGMEARGDSSENLSLQITKTRKLTEKPFGANIPLDLGEAGLLIDLVLKEKVTIVVTSAGSPTHYTELLRQNGATVMHVVSSVKQAQRAEACEVDAVIVEGAEAAGHIGFDELPSFSLIPQVTDALSVPVIAAGGIVDARGVVAALSLGAEGVQMGTRFVAVEENIASLTYKKAIVEARDTDTVVTCRRLLPTRSLKTEFSRRLLDLEQTGTSAGDMRNFLGYSRARKGQLEGDLTHGEAYCGASAGLIKEIIPVAVVVQEVVEGYEAVVQRLV